MFRRFAHLLLIVALLGATGAHWAVLQSVAWATMLADNARVVTLSTAIENTFDGKHPCALCRSIAHGRQGERRSDVQSESRKLEFVNDSAVIFTNPSGYFEIVSAANASGPQRTRTPPVPPPRSFFI